MSPASPASLTLPASSTLPSHADVVIIGGGVMGTSAAFHLAEAGVTNILLLERDSLGGGSTCRSAGGVRAQFSQAVNIELGARSLPAFEQFGVRPGAPIDLHQVGYLFLHTDPLAWAAAQQAVALQNSLGVPTQLLTPEQAHERSPGVVVDDVLGATFHARDGYCSPEAVVQGYAQAARGLGATVLTGTGVTGIETSGGQITGVRTASGVVACDTVICTAGAWSQQVGDWAGVPLPVQPLRRQILVTQPLPPELAQRFGPRTPMTIDASSTLYLHREGPGLLIGMSDPDQAPGFVPAYSQEWLPGLMEMLSRRAPDLLDLGIAHRWAGYYEVTPDHNALVGEAAQTSRFLYATGFSGHGFLQGPAIGEVMRDLYLQVTPAIDVSSLAAERFGAGSVLREQAIV